MKISHGEADRFCARPPESLRAALLFGPDEGLVRERGKLLARQVCPDLQDPFRVAELSGAVLTADPARLADEAAALALTGGRRVVWVEAVGDSHAALFDDLLEASPGEALVLALAGELPARSSLRKTFEKASQAAAIPCYRDEQRDLSRVIRESLSAAGLKITDEALAFLRDHLGGDRQVTRRELEKLALYKGSGAATVSLEDAVACIGDSDLLTLDDVVFAVGDGDLPRLERALRRSFAEGTQPVALLRATARHFQRLHAVAGAARGGDSFDAAMRRLRPPVFWKVADRFRAQSGRWSAQALTRTLRKLMDAECTCKRSGMPAATIASEALFAIASASPLRRRS